jgi:energy-coupling factor transport system ATP-binding protein
VVELGRLAGWTPLPLSVRDARRVAQPLRESIAPQTPEPARPSASTGSRLLRARKVLVRYGDVIAVRGVDIDFAANEVTALMGRNGSGKSSLLWAIQGSGKRQSGVVEIDGKDPKTLSARHARTLVGLVPQTPADLLYLETVRNELVQADSESEEAVSRLSLVLAVQLRAAPPVVLLDEPTRGLDYHAKRALVGIVHDLATGGRAVVIATHDVEFVAAAADRVVVMADGDIVADGPTADVVVSSPAFAPQVAKILAPLEFLTVDQVRAALDRVVSRP